MRADFYLLNDKSPWLITCKIIEKAYAQKHKIFVLAANKEEAENLDELLWTYKEESFIPHNLQGEGPEPPPPVQIGYKGTNSRGFNDILINFAIKPPEFIKEFKRVIEIVPNTEEEKAKSREKYKIYKAEKFMIHTHNIA